MSSAFIQAAVILLREGLEAMLVIAALAGYLTKAGAGHRIQALYGGALAAVAASIVAAWLFAVLNSGEHSDVLEGVIGGGVAAVEVGVAAAGERGPEQQRREHEHAAQDARPAHGAAPPGAGCRGLVARDAASA